MGMRDIWLGPGIRDLEFRLLAPRQTVSMHPVSSAINLTGWVSVQQVLECRRGKGEGGDPQPSL